MKTVKVRKFKKEGSLIVRDTNGELLTFLADSVHTMTELFFQRPLGISLLRDNELELCNPESFMELQPEVVEVPVESVEIQAEDTVEVVTQEIETIAEPVEQSLDPVVEEDKPKQDKKKNNKKESGG